MQTIPVHPSTGTPKNNFRITNRINKTMDRKKEVIPISEANESNFVEKAIIPSKE